MAAHSDGSSSSPHSESWKMSKECGQEGGSADDSCTSEVDDSMVYRPRENNAIKYIETDNRFVCTLCKKSFDKRRYVSRHIRKVHNHSDAQHRCPICDRFLMQKSDLKRHLRTHSDDKEYNCTVCGKSFTRKDSLVVHKRQHSNEYSYKCLECKKGFHSRVSLESHIRIHTGVRPFPCEICHANFRQKGDLTRHLQSHMGIKPFACKYCGKMFGRNADLRRHQTTHFEEKPYSCTLCSKGFTRKYLYTKHMMFHEGNEGHIESNNNQVTKCDEILSSKSIDKSSDSASRTGNIISGMDNSETNEHLIVTQSAQKCLPQNMYHKRNEEHKNIKRAPMSNRRKNSKPTRCSSSLLYKSVEDLQVEDMNAKKQLPVSFTSCSSQGVMEKTDNLNTSSLNTNSLGSSLEFSISKKFSKPNLDIIGVLPLDLSLKSSRHTKNEPSNSQLPRETVLEGEDSSSFIIVD